MMTMGGWWRRREGGRGEEIQRDERRSTLGFSFHVEVLGSVAHSHSVRAVSKMWKKQKTMELEYLFRTYDTLTTKSVCW